MDNVYKFNIIRFVLKIKGETTHTPVSETHLEALASELGNQVRLQDLDALKFLHPTFQALKADLEENNRRDEANQVITMITITEHMIDSLENRAR